MSDTRSRIYFVDIATIEKVMDACPNQEWRTIFALSRFGGLRCPSEIFGLRWSDIFWDQNRLRVRSPKTEHHEGKDERFTPLFPELVEELQKRFEEAEEGEEYVISTYRNLSGNLRSVAADIIQRAGVPSWPKPFHNLRASRQTELSRIFPLPMVCEWLGNSPEVAKAHYIRATDLDFAEAAKKATQNPTQLPAALACTGTHHEQQILDILQELHSDQDIEGVQWERKDSNLRRR